MGSEGGRQERNEGRRQDRGVKEIGRKVWEWRKQEGGGDRRVMGVENRDEIVE